MTRFPNGLETAEIDVSGAIKAGGAITATGAITAGGAITATGAITAGDTITAPALAGAVTRGSASVNATDDVALTAAQKLADNITISAAGSGKVLTLGMGAGRLLVITNAGENNVTVKQKAADEGATATTVKTAMFLTSADSVAKISGDV